MKKKSSIPGIIVAIVLVLFSWLDRYHPIPYGKDAVTEVPLNPGVVHATSVDDVTGVPTETLIPTATPTPTNTSTATISPTSTVTQTPTSTSVPPVRVSVNHQTAHDMCGTWADVFIVVDGQDVFTPQWIECWPRESRSDERLLVWEGAMVFDFAFPKPDAGFSESYINTILPFGFEAATYEIIVYCDDRCEIEAFYDEEAYPFWIQEVRIEQGIVSFTFDADGRDGYLLISHADYRGGSSVYAYIQRVDQ